MLQILKLFYTMLLEEINKIKAENKIIVGLFDKSMIKNIKAFIKYLYSGKFNKKVKLPLFNGELPEITKASKLIYWYKEKNIDAQIIEVEENEVLVEYKKPHFGKNGFNAYGVVIDVNNVTNVDDLSFKIDTKSIKIQENEEKKLYISKEKGFVNIINNTLIIDHRVEMAKISRVENSLAVEEENNIEVHISQNDYNRDSIGEGVELTSQTIHVSGHVGANSILEARSLQIDGATHQDSTQFARYAKINRHKGNIRCKEAKITLLEGGEVHATRAEIQTAMSGSVYAKDVYIHHVKNNVKVFASNSITIDLVSGEDNIFKINYKDIPIMLSKIELIEDDIEDLRYELEEAKRHNHLEVPNINKKILKFKKDIQDIKESSNVATIKIKKPFIGLNHIIFELQNGDEISFKTESIAYDTFHLDISDEKITLLPVGKSIEI